MEELVRVAVVQTQIAAEMAASMLEVEGIRSLWRRTVVGTLTFRDGGIGGAGLFEILVQPEDAERAYELLTQPATEDPASS